MASIKERLSQRISALREERPSVDHLVRMQEHYGAVKAGQQAGAVTYFGFLSFFPILALAFFVVGLVSQVFSDADATLLRAIDSVLPDIVGTDPDQISLDDIRTFSGWAAVIGVLGVLYSGLGWLSALRDALIVVFQMPEREQPGFVSGKLRDLTTLTVVGLVLLVAVAVTGFVSGFSGDLLDWLGLGRELAAVVTLLTIVVGLGANAVLFFALYRLLAEPHLPRSSLWRGAIFGAVGFEVLKQASAYLLAATKDQPAFQAFGIALILLVWINYFSRVVLYSAAFACTTPEARAAAYADVVPPVQGPPLPSGEDGPFVPDPAARPAPSARSSWWAPFAAGGAAMLVLVRVLRGKS